LNDKKKHSKKISQILNEIVIYIEHDWYKIYLQSDLSKS